MVVDRTFNITDVDANERFIYVPVRDAKVVYVYKNDLNGNYDMSPYTIDSSDIKDQSEGFIFSPVETMLSPSDINVLLIKNFDSILILRITAFEVDYISMIPIPNLAFSYIFSEVVVGKYSMIVIISNNNTDSED